MLATIHEYGYAEASVGEFVRRAGMTRTEFDARFSGKREVTALILEAHLDRFQERVGRAYAIADDWPDNLRAAAYETARCILENPDATWFLMVGVLEVDDMLRARRDQFFVWGAELIDGGRAAAPDPAAIPDSASLLAIGAIVETIRRRRAAGVEHDVARNLPKFMYTAVRPYLGEEAARAELTIELPPDLRSS
ncbi:MAG TPA: hypothetical protein VGI17_06695 [Solirubrobacterales bacterium]